MCFFEFIPQLFFMLCIFGYMVFLIFYKWAAPQSHWNAYGIAPPFLLNVMIQMFLSPVNLLAENTLFDGQSIVQPVFLITAIICVPLMLLVKPLWLRHVNNSTKGMVPSHSSGHGGDEEEFDFSEVFVKQCIHTIEYVLGAISNTASYLRLWALSLAHSELASVFWNRLFIFLYQSGEGSLILQAICAFAGFGGWAGATFAVLLVMEALSAFLHALRLHWVEFQNKFYRGDGTQFLPFSYQRLLSGADDE